MCSVFGVIRHNKSVANDEIMMNLLETIGIAGECRGTHATGISYTSNGTLKVSKEAKRASNFDFSVAGDADIIIGHTRHATKGTPRVNGNNHPFKVNTNLSYAHNGVIWNDEELKDKYNLNKKGVQVDSYIVARLLRMHNTITPEIIEKECAKLKGTFVLTFYDKSKEEVEIIRHNNPLSVYVSKILGITIYASTEKMLNKFRLTGLLHDFERVEVGNDEIVKLTRDGEAVVRSFKYQNQFNNTTFNTDWRSYKLDW